MRNRQPLHALHPLNPADAAGRGFPDRRSIRQVGHASPAANEPLVDGHDGWARHAAAANGFGDAVMADLPLTDVGGSRAEPGTLEAPVRRAAGGLAALGRNLVSAWQRRRAARAIEVALRELDDRSLRDLGLDPSEIRSVAGEVAGLTEITRAHAFYALGHRMF